MVDYCPECGSKNLIDKRHNMWSTHWGCLDCKAEWLMLPIEHSPFNVTNRNYKTGRKGNK